MTPTKRCEHCQSPAEELLTLRLPTGATIRVCAACFEALKLTLGLAPQAFQIARRAIPVLGQLAT